jgi:hypothetical protein
MHDFPTETKRAQKNRASRLTFVHSSFADFECGSGVLCSLGGFSCFFLFVRRGSNGFLRFFNRPRQLLLAFL